VDPELETSLRQKLVDILLQDEEKFVSGQKISTQLNCSRTAIWKHITELRKAGYEIEAIQKKGYRIKSKPNRISSTEIQHRLQTKRLGSSIHYEETVFSTQEIAHRIALTSEKEGTVVIAEKQTAGRGRLGRPWHSPKGTGIWMSLILKPKIFPQQAPQLTLLTAVSVVKGIKRATGIDAEIKWPNDILINGKKVAGILTELHADPDRIHFVIVGIGVNVNHTQTDFPDQLQSSATSLRMAAQKEINRAEVVKCILDELEKLYDAYLTRGFDVVKLLWESYAASLGKMVTVKSLKGEELYGLAKGISNDGALILMDEDGTRHTIYSADIHIPNSQ
jgi:BirA family biotin operon repressor/biotin-[acetyl-CoA-carboxylase] ligase